MKKYELDKNYSIKVNGHTLYRIIYTDEFIKKYEEKYGCNIFKIGGFIESETNLSQDNYAVVLDNAVVYGNAKVYDNAQVFGNAEIYGNAKIYDNAEVYGYSKVYGDAEVRGEVMDVSISCN